MPFFDTGAAAAAAAAAAVRYRTLEPAAGWIVRPQLEPHGELLLLLLLLRLLLLITQGLSVLFIHSCYTCEKSKEVCLKGGTREGAAHDRASGGGLGRGNWSTRHAPRPTADGFIWYK